MHRGLQDEPDQTGKLVLHRAAQGSTWDYGLRWRGCSEHGSIVRQIGALCLPAGITVPGTCPGPAGSGAED